MVCQKLETTGMKTLLGLLTKAFPFLTKWLENRQIRLKHMGDSLDAADDLKAEKKAQRLDKIADRKNRGEWRSWADLMFPGKEHRNTRRNIKKRIENIYRAGGEVSKIHEGTIHYTDKNNQPQVI